ncbi:MAG: class I SAM-dependent methyltransferase, partial [Rhodoferax sp.]|nr:class I SAM-dependent methyltransferase [Rhodoferax sp.]
LLLLLLLLLLYPVKAWRDAPLFPTPADALRTLAQHAPLEGGARVLDAGCGLGHGLRALRASYPHVELHGIEWSWPLRAVCGLCCPWAQVRQGDIWSASWADFDLVYLFQRPESMARAAAKARSEMRPGRWLVSLEFEASLLVARHAVLLQDGRTLWLYQMAGVAPTTQHAADASK